MIIRPEFNHAVFKWSIENFVEKPSVSKFSIIASFTGCSSGLGGCSCYVHRWQRLLATTAASHNNNSFLRDNDFFNCNGPATTTVSQPWQSWPDDDGLVVTSVFATTAAFATTTTSFTTTATCKYTGLALIAVSLDAVITAPSWQRLFAPTTTFCYDGGLCCWKRFLALTTVSCKHNFSHLQPSA